MELREVPKFILCPCCNEKYNDAEKRRIIDSCGHPRCFTCLCKISACPNCSKSKQITDIGVQSPGSDSNDYVRWKPRSVSMSANIQTGILQKDQRSKSLCQLNTRSALQKVYPRSNSTDSNSNSTTDALADNSVIDTTDIRNRKDGIKIDRKLSFSSVLNRNSESYKRSRFRRASSFSFMPRESLATINGDDLSFESNLKIRHRPRPKSLNLTLNENNGGDSSHASIQCSHGYEDKKDSNKRRIRLDSIVEMASAWLEESKSVMQNQCFATASENFHFIEEEKAQAENNDCSAIADINPKPNLGKQNERGTLNGGTFTCRFINEKRMPVGKTDDSDSISNSEGKAKSEAKNVHTTKRCVIACALKSDECDISNHEVEPVSKDFNASVSPDLTTAMEEESYLQDVRELLKGLKKEGKEERNENAYVVNTDCVMENFTPQQGFIECEDEIDATVSCHYQRRCGKYTSPLQDLETKSGIDTDGTKALKQLQFEEFPIDTVEEYKKSIDYAIEASKTGIKCNEEKLSVVKESSAIDNKRDEQEENHSRANYAAKFTGWDTSSKQTDTQTSVAVPLQSVPVGVVGLNSFTFSAINDLNDLNDQISSNDPQIKKEKTLDSLPRALVKRSVRPRSFSSIDDIKGKMTEIQYLPSLKKNRSKRTSSFGTFKNEWKSPTAIKKSDFDTHVASSSPNGTSEALAVMSLPQSNHENCNKATASLRYSRSSDEPRSFESLEDRECHSDLHLTNVGDSEAAAEPSNKHESSSIVGEHSGNTNVRYLDESIDLHGSEKLNPSDEPVIASTFSYGTEECPALSGNNLATGSESSLEVDDHVEEIFINKTDDWKSVNLPMIHGKDNIDITQHIKMLDNLTVQDREVPVVFINGDDFCPSWHNKEKTRRKVIRQESNRERKGRSRDKSTSLRHSQTPGIGFLREKFQKLARWSKKGNETESEKSRRKYAFTRRHKLKQNGKKNVTSLDAIGSSGAKNISFYDVNRNIVMSSNVVRSMRESRKIRGRKLDLEEGCSLNKKQLPKKEKQFQDNERLFSVKKRWRPAYNEDKKALLKPNQTDDVSLTTVSTLVDNFNHYSDTESSSFSAHGSDEEGDSSDSTLNHHLLHSNYSSSSDTINESIEESEMPDFRAPSRIQEDLAALLERKVTRKRQGLEEIDFYPLIPATKGKALVPRDWLYERFHLLLDGSVKDAKKVLLISGRNGCGKTTLLKSLIWSDCIGHGKKRMREKISRSILSFHFCSKADANTTSAAKFVLNMAACLVENSQFAAYTRSLFDSNFLRNSLSRETAEKSPEIALKDGILKPLNEIYGSGCNRNYLLLLDSLDHDCNQCRPEECITSLLASNVHLLPSWVTLVIAGTKESLQLFDRQEADEISLENIANWDVQSDLYSFTEMELPILSSQLSQSKIQKLVDNIVRFCRGSFHIAHMSIQYLSSSFASFIHQPNLHSLDVDKLVGHLFNMKFCITERSKVLALSLLEILLVSQELLTLSNLFKAVECSCTSQSISFQEYESCLRKLLQLEMIAESIEGRYFVNNITRHWMQSNDALKTGFSPSKGHNLLSVYYMKTLTNNDGKNIYLLAYHLSQSSFGEDIKDNEKRVSFLAWTLNQVFKDATGGFLESCNVYRPIVEVYHLFLHTELDLKAFQREYGAHPIVIASSLKQTHLVSLILQHKMFEGSHLHHALEEAMRVGSTDIFDILIANASGVSLLKPRDQGTRKSCLDIALESDQIVAAVKLVAFVWKTENEDDPSRAVAAQRVLCKACLHGRIDIVEMLLSGGYIRDIDELDNEANAPLVLAASGNHLITAKCLLENHGNVDVIDGNGLTPLLASVINGNIETSEWLISQDANVNAEDKAGRTPLIYAAIKDLPHLVHSLFMEGSTLNHQDHSGLTALSHACKNGCNEVVKTLLMNRALTEIEDGHKRTPIHYACLNRNLHSIQILLDHGANVNHKNGKGQKPLEIALKEGYLDVAALLLRYGAHVGKTTVNIAESSIGAFLCLVGHLEQRGNIMIKAGKYVAANEDFQRALNIIDNSAHRNNKRVVRIKLLCQQDSRHKFI